MTDNTVILEHPKENPIAMRKNSVLYGLAASHFTNDFYQAILPIFLPALIVALKLSYFEAGIASFISIVIAAIFQPLVGYYADLHIKRKTVIISGLVIIGLSVSAISFVSSYPVLLLVCAAMGVGGSTFHAQSTNLLSMHYPTKKGMIQGIHGLGGGLGVFSAPVAAGFLIASLGWQKSAALLIIPAIVMAVVASKVVVEPMVKGGKGFLKGISSDLLLLSIVYGLNVMIVMGFMSFLPTYFVGKGYPIAQAGLLSSIMLFSGLIAQPIGGHISDLWGRKNILTASLFLIAFSVYLFSISHGYAVFLALVLIGFVSMIAWPVGLAFASELAMGQLGERGGTSVGLVFGISLVLSSLAPIFVGKMADHYGFENAFLFLGIFAVLGGIIACFLPGKIVKPTRGCNEIS